METHVFCMHQHHTKRGFPYSLAAALASFCLGRDCRYAVSINFFRPDHFTSTVLFVEAGCDYQ
eukprot:scaffold267157_cov18-Tisochrysis_lutea.AAC.1